MMRPRRLADVASFRNGANFLRSDRGHVARMIGVGDFLDRETIDSSAQLQTVQLATEPKADDYLEFNDLLFVRSNGSKSLVGRCIVYKGAPQVTTFSGFTIRARIVDESIDPTYIAAAVRSPLFRSHLKRFGGGSSITNLSQESLGAFTVPVPSLAEQRKITEILGTWDEAITHMTAMRTLFQDRHQWLRGNVLTARHRIQGFDGEWVKGPLSLVLHEHGARSSGREKVYSVSVHRGLVNQIDHLGRSFAATSTDHYSRVFPGDVVYTKSPTGEFPLGIVKQSTADEAVLVSPLYGVFTPRTRELGSILHAFFESPTATSNFLGPLVQKGAKNTISITNRRFLEGELNLPADPREQEAIATLIENSTREINLLDREIALLKEQKRGLMQKLLTGEIRVAVDPTEEVAP